MSAPAAPAPARAESSSAAVPAAKHSKAKGLSKVPIVRYIASSLIKKAKLELTSLHVYDITATGFSLRGKLKVSKLGLGPIPLVKASIAIPPGQAKLLWIKDSTQSNAASGKAAKKAAKAAEAKQATYVANATVKPFRLRPTPTPGGATAQLEVSVSLDPNASGGEEGLEQLIKSIFISEPDAPIRLVLRTPAAEVRAYGLRFSGLVLDKELVIGGLGALNGALNFGPQAGLSAPSSSASAVPPLKVSDFNIIGGHPTRGIEIQLAATLENPSRSPALSVEPGDFRLVLAVSAAAPDSKVPAEQLYASSRPGIPAGLVEIGSLKLAAVVLRPGSNVVRGHGYILPGPQPREGDTTSPAAIVYEAGQRTVSAILEDRPLSVTALTLDASGGAQGVSDVAWLSRALHGGSIVSEVPALGELCRILDGAELRVEAPKIGNTSPALGSSRARTTSASAPSLNGSYDSSTAAAAGRIPPSPRSPSGLLRSPEMHATAGPGGASTSDASSASSLEASSTARATLRNSFAVDLYMTSCIAYTTPCGMDPSPELGSLRTPRKWEGLLLPKGGQAVHASFPFILNKDALTLLSIMRFAAARRSVDLGPRMTELFDRMLGPDPATSGAGKRKAEARSATDKDPSHDLAGLLARAFYNMRVTAQVQTGVRIGDYTYPGMLRFTQQNLPISFTEAASAALLPDIGMTFIRDIIERAEVVIERVSVLGMDEDGIAAEAGVMLENFGPLAAVISLVEPANLIALDGPRKGERVGRLFIEDRLAMEPGMKEAVRASVRIAPPTGAGATEAFSQLVLSLLRDKQAKFELVANRVVALSGGINFVTQLRKEITITGLGGFENLTISNFMVLGEAQAPVGGGSLSRAVLPSPGAPARGALQVCAGCKLVNPGDTSIMIARLELGIEYEGAPLGQLAIEDLHLEPYAEVTQEARGLIYVEEASAVKGLQALGQLVSKLVGGQKIDLVVRGERAWIHPAPIAGGSTHKRRASSEPKRQPWLDAALRSFKINVSLQEDPMLLVNSVDVHKLDASFPSNSAPLIAVSKILIDYSVPYPITLGVTSAAAEVELTFDGEIVGRATTTDGTVSHAQESGDENGAAGLFRLALETFELQTQDDATMAKLIAHVFDAGPEGTQRISLRGVAHVKAKTIVGELPLTVHLGKEHRIRIAGLDGLRTSPVQYSGFQVVDANPAFLLAKFSLFLNNPSPSVHIRLPDSSLTLGVYFQDTFVGRANIPGGSFDMPCGPVAIHNVEFRYAPKQEDKVRALPSNLLSGKKSTLQVRGDAESTDLAMLVPALSAIRLEFTLKPMLSELLESIAVTITPTVLTKQSIECAFIVRNPLAVPIDLLTLSFSAMYQSQPFGSASDSFKGERACVIPPGTSQRPGRTTGHIPVRLAQSLDRIVKTFLAERGTIYLDVEVEARVSLQGFSIPVFEYKQTLPLIVEGLGGVSKLLSIF